MTDHTNHPTTDDLTAFTLGQLPEDIAQQIESHINNCDPCCQTMLGISSEDTFVDLLQQADQVKPIHTSVTSHSGNNESTDRIPQPLSTHPRYKIEEAVGHGGMGRVFRARHRVMDRTVALKVIHQEWVRKQDAVERFHREVKTAASLHHPNIVTAYDAEQADNLHFLVMEFVDGIDLAKEVKQRGRLPVATACDYIRQAAEGLQHAHDQGMVHRDIKPHNLIVTSDGVVKILDFGLASLVPQATSNSDFGEDAEGNLTIAGTIMGTPDFISPEQARDAHRVDGRSDIYSLGMTLYYLLAGNVPFTEGTASDKLKQHAEDDPVSLTNVRDDVPEELQAVVARMTAKDPAERYQSPREVEAALGKFVGSLQHEPMSTQSTKPAAGGEVRKVIFASGVFLLAMAVIVTAGVLLAGALVNFNAPSVPDEVHGPLSDLDSYIVSMMDSPHDLVFLNLSEIGPDKNYFSFKPIEGGVMMAFPAMDTGRYSRRQGRYVETLKRVTESLSLQPDEESRFNKDGSVGGVHFQFPITGEPDEVSDTIRKVIRRTFQVNESEACEFVYRNLPAASSSASGGGHKQVSGDEFVQEYEKGKRVYFGEIKNLIYLIPQARRAEKTFQPDPEVWIANINELPLGAAAKIRQGVATEPNKTEIVEPELNLLRKGSNATKHGVATMHNWDLEGRGIGELQVKLWLANNGTAQIVQQYRFEKKKPSCTTQVRLLIGDTKQEGHKRTLSATLDVSTTGLNAQVDSGRVIKAIYGSVVGQEEQTDQILPITIEAPFSMVRSPEIKKRTTVGFGSTYLLFVKAYWKDDLQHEDSVEGIIEGSKQGATFLYVTVDWKPAGEKNRGDAPRELGKRRAPAKQDRTLGTVSELFSYSPELRQQVADKFLAEGKTDQAAAILALGTDQKDPKAKAWGELATKFEKSNELGKAVDAWLSAYRADPRTLSRHQIPLFQRTNRLGDLAEILTEDRLKQLPPANSARLVLEAVLESPSTRNAGLELLKRVWITSEQHHSRILYYLRRKDVWKEITDKAFFFRTKFVPEDIPAAGAGWEFLSINTYDGYSDRAYHPLLTMQPQLDLSTVETLIPEVAELLQQYPEWKAGLAFQAVLKANAGEFDEAAQLLQPFVANLDDNSIPRDSAWLVGLALDGKNQSLDRVVKKLYERSVIFSKFDPSDALRRSPITDLARLNARMGMTTKGRDILYRLAKQDYDDKPYVICSDGRIAVNSSRCNECHKRERNLIDVTLMADTMTDIGYPVDALLSLYRIDSSFGNIYGGTDAWAKQTAPEDLYSGNDYFGKPFRAAKTKAEQAITVQSIIDALDTGAMAKQLPNHQPLVVDPDAPDIPRIELMLSIGGGEDARPTLFSPVIDMLEQVASTADETDLDRLDAELTRVPPGHRKSLDEMIVATIFSFQRNRIAEAKQRVQQMFQSIESRELDARDIGVWLVAQRALAVKPTQALGEQLAIRARAAAAKTDSVPEEFLRSSKTSVTKD